VLQSFVLYAQNALKLTYEYLAFLKKFLGSLSLAMRGGKEEGGAEGREARKGRARMSPQNVSHGDANEFNRV
jgi:hypothetical protein